MIQATIAVYPLQQTDYEAVHHAIEALSQKGIRVEVQAMQTIISGSNKAVFGAIRAAYEAAAVSGPTVMTTTISNACPIADFSVGGEERAQPLKLPHTEPPDQPPQLETENV